MKKISLSLIMILMLSSCSNPGKNNKSLASNYLEQSIVEMRGNNLKQALHLINRSLTVHETLEAMSHKAQLLYQLGDLEGSLACFDKIINKKELSDMIKADALNNYACTLYRLSRKDEAQKIWKELTKNTLR